jgi:hypothetical protein
VPLGSPLEFWNDDLTRYESAEAVRAAEARRGWPADDAIVLHDITSTLISDVINAAGGIEGAVIRIHEAVDRLSAFAKPLMAAGQLSEGDTLVHPYAEEAWYALEEMTIWCRTLCERLKRERRGGPDQGLIPAMAEGPARNAVLAARDKHLRPVMDLRHFANLNLHYQPTVEGSKRAKIVDGVVVVPFPDRVDDPIAHSWELSYSRYRDALTVADEVMTALDWFMDAMLDAFENNIPARFL